MVSGGPVMQLLCHDLGLRVLEGELALIRGPSVWTDPGAVSSCPLNESAHSCRIETGPDQSRHVAYGLQVRIRHGVRRR